MKEPRNHLSRDLEALRYMDALNAGDLEAVTAAWEDASHDPELERMLAELDGAMFGEVRGNQSSLAGRFGPRRRWTIWGGAVVALVAACLLAMLAWPPRDTKNPAPTAPMSETANQVVLQPPDVSHGVIPLPQGRRDLEAVELPPFNWPLENSLSLLTPLDLVN